MASAAKMLSACLPSTVSNIRQIKETELSFFKKALVFDVKQNESGSYKFFSKFKRMLPRFVTSFLQLRYMEPAMELY